MSDGIRKSKRTKRKKRATEPQDNTPITESAETITASGEFDEEDWGDDGMDDDDFGGDDDDEWGNSDVEADDDWATEFDDPSTTKKESHFKVVERGQVPQMMSTLVDEVSSVCGLDTNQTVLLLLHSKWDSGWAIRRYFDEQDRVCRDAGIAFAEGSPKKKSKKKRVECLICCERVVEDKTFSLNCEHGPYCKSCWKKYLRERFDSCLPSNVALTSCMWPNCYVRVGPSDFHAVLTSKYRKRYDDCLLRGFVEINNKARWCPGKNCENAVFYNGEGETTDTVKCYCGTLFCYGCQMEKHNPISCRLLKKWTIKNRSEGENVIWIRANTKACPKCGIDIEKNGGCMHMTCARCKHEWCWQCRGPWEKHGSETGGFFSCNRFDSKAKDKDEEAVKWKHQVERYRHYYERYFNHDMAQKQTGAEDRRVRIVAKMEKMRQESNRDPEFLSEALDLVIECRIVLKHTYVMGYYIPDDEKTKKLFEFTQGRAEYYTELLTDLIETPTEDMDVEKLKNMVRVTRQFLDKLVQEIEDPSPHGAGEIWRAALTRAESAEQVS